MIEGIIITTLFCIGIHKIFRSGGAVLKLRSILDWYLPWFIRWPLYFCLPCMASIWGSVGYYILGGDISSSWLLFVGAVCGLNWMAEIFFVPSDLDLIQESDGK